ncbi:hypothetical protein [Oceaniglobus roseus]|uniref:hypothetical protein n=1 Tax=Oceaniglobus roseus TaxID=1737570 RepID=UPI000C7F36F4|nr:hypothetical protein [Kandeliimicrobium roseum]
MADPAPRVIVHAGFHKTGTTSLQAFVERHRKALSPYAQIHIKTDLGRARYLGRWYGQRPSAFRRWLFRLGLAAFLRRLDDGPVHFISRESFSGMMPGFHRRGRRVTGYGDTAIPLARAIVDGLRRRFGPEVRIEFLYTLRDGEAFVRSLHGHILRTSPLTEDEAAFRAGFPAEVDLAAEAARIAAAIAPVPVHTERLEEMTRHRLGPGIAVLRLLGVPREEWRRFTAAPPNNPGPDAGQRAEMLEINRTGGRRAALRRRKEALMAARP